MAEKKEPGCGWTERRVVGELIALASQKYEEGLMRLGVKPTKRQTLKDGYLDGFQAALRHLEGMGVLVVVDSMERDLDVSKVSS